MLKNTLFGVYGGVICCFEAPVFTPMFRAVVIYVYLSVCMYAMLCNVM